MIFLNKKEATQRVEKFLENFIEKHDLWSKISTPNLLIRVPETTDFITLCKPYNNLTYLIILVALKYQRGIYEINVGWSDILPLDNPLNTNIRMKYPLSHHLENGETEEFDLPYMLISLERLHGALTRSRYKIKNDVQDSEFDLIYQDLEEVAIEYWKIMLKRRFNVDANDLTL